MATIITFSMFGRYARISLFDIISQEGSMPEEDIQPRVLGTGAEHRHMPAISVLVPVYNVERYLAECLESLRGQTFQDFEAICINDGSTDGSRGIIAEFVKADGRFTVIDKANSGYGASMNQGLAAARGEHVAFLESDDFFEPTALATLHDAIVRFDAEVAKANFWLFWSVPQPRDELFELVSPQMASRLVNPQDEWEIFYKKPSIWSGLYRRDFLAANDIKFLETPGASYQDAGFNFKVWASATRAVFLHEAVLHYRQDNEASSVNSPSKVYCVCDEYAEMERYLQARPERREYLKAVKAKMKFDSYMWNYDRLSEPLQREFIVRMADELRQEISDGALDWALFDDWCTGRLKEILDSPEGFHVHHVTDMNTGLLGKIRSYYRIGGLGMVARRVREKLARGDAEKLARGASGNGGGPGNGGGSGNGGGPGNGGA
jgi:glycosyltransferase involved in cell wall biosynthesis